MENKSKGEDFIDILDTPAFSIIWFSCIEEDRSIKDIKNFWQIEDKYSLYKELKTLKEVGLVEAQMDKMTKNLGEYNIRSNLSWLACLIPMKLMGEIYSLPIIFPKIDEFYELLTHWFFEKSEDEKKKIIESDYFKKIIMKTERIVRINNNLKNLSLKTYQEGNIKEQLLKYDTYTEKELDKELNDLLKEKIKKGRILMLHLLILTLLSKDYHKNREKCEFIKQSNKEIEFFGTKITGNEWIIGEVKNVVKDIDESKCSIPNEIPSSLLKVKNDYYMNKYSKELKQFPIEFRKKLFRTILR